MSVSRPIFWHQGMFLQPQHFQMADQLHQAQLYPYQNYIQPYLWGVNRLGLQTSALPQRICEVDSGELMFPDGTYVSIPDNGVVKSRSFADEWVDQDKPFTIYIGLRRLEQYEDNVTIVNDFQALDTIKTRFVSKADADEVKDLYQRGSVNAQVKSLNYVLKIVWESEKDEMNDYQLIPIARVIRDGEAIQFAQDFNPPLLHISGSRSLMRRIKEIRDETTGRFTQLDAYKLHESRDYDPNMVRYKLAQQTLSRFIPRLFHYTETGNVHPWVVYGAIREFIGEVSTFTDSVNVLGETRDGKRLLPQYNHFEIGNCFEAAHTLITMMLNEITIGPKHLVEMEFDGLCFTAGIPNEFFKEDNEFFLVINTAEDFHSYQHSLFTAAKLSSRDNVQTLVDRSLPGVGMIHLPVAPPGLPRKANTYYVRLDKHNDAWMSVIRTQDAALLWEDSPGDVRIELVVLRR